MTFADKLIATTVPPRGRDRVEEKIHSLLPRRVTVWQMALEQVDFSRPAPGDQGRMGLWLPEAEFVVGPAQPWRLYAYLGNWIRARCAFWRLLSKMQRFEPPRASSWRIFIGRLPENPDEENEARTAVERKQRSVHQRAKRQQEREDACGYFAALLKQEVRPREPLLEEVTWRGCKLTQADIAGGELPPAIRRAVREMAWELSETAFRVELYELDRHLVPAARECYQDYEWQRRRLVTAVFPDHHFAIPALPASSRGGLSATDLRGRAECLEGLRRVLVRWPRAPRMFSRVRIDCNTPRDDLRAFEWEAASFYCQQFYESFGRPAVVPRYPD